MNILRKTKGGTKTAEAHIYQSNRAFMRHVKGLSRNSVASTIFGNFRVNLARRWEAYKYAFRNHPEYKYFVVS